MASASPPRLSRERILRAAQELVEQDGLEGFSMRRLAQELDVWPMSVYRHFRDRDELLDALAARAAERLPAPSGDGSWREQIFALLTDARAAMTAGAGLRLPRAFLAPAVLRLSDAGLAILAGAGLPPAVAARAWRALWSYTFGFSTFSLGPDPAEAGRRTRSALAALPEDEYPALTSAGEEFASAFTSEEQFERGLDLLLDGIESSLRGSEPASGLG